jgi:TonB family protein
MNLSIKATLSEQIHHPKQEKYIIYSEGHKSAEGIYENNKPSGEWTFYYSDDPAKIWYKLVYDTGRPKELTSYYKSGKEKRREFYDQTYHVTGKCYDQNGDEIKYTPFLIMPTCTYSLDSFLVKKLHYPENAREQSTQGLVIIQFTIDTDGNVRNIKILRGIGGGCDEEAVRVIASLPKWTPGMQDDVTAKTLFTKPINFTLR